MIIFLSCTKTKQKHPCPAVEMYWPSSLFRGGYKYAQTLNPDDIFILSAKYGLLKPEDMIAPYEKTLITEKDQEIRRWSMMVAKQLQESGVDQKQKAIFLCGKPYRKYIQNLFPNHSAPCAHMGIGEQMHFFKEMSK